MLCAPDRQMIDRFQRAFPLAPEPFAEIALALDLAPDFVLARIGHLVETGVISRVGAVVRPNSAGASTLAAMAAPPARLDSIAALVNEEPGVNHNYEREHAINLWFVVTGSSRAAVSASLARIEARTGVAALDLPLLRAFHIDLGFPLFAPDSAQKKSSWRADPPPPDADELALLIAIEDGLPLCPRPYWEVARRLGWSEIDVIDRLKHLVATGVIARFGLVVRHHSLGYRANAMVVWDVEDASVGETAALLAAAPSVTLCYERPRRLPHWRYNLFCMIHGRDRDLVHSEIAALAARVGPASRGHDILFSRRCFRQRGARLSAA